MFRIASILAGTALVLPLPAPAYADGAAHEFHAEAWEGSEPFLAGEGPCVDWAGTFHESRTGGYRVVAAPGGRSEGELHVNGRIDGHVELVPYDSARPSYHGDYREKVNAVVTGQDEEHGDLARVAQFRLRLPLTGTDGSSFVVEMSGKLTQNAQGAWTVTRQHYDCVSR